MVGLPLNLFRNDLESVNAGTAVAERPEQAATGRTGNSSQNEAKDPLHSIRLNASVSLSFLVGFNVISGKDLTSRYPRVMRILYTNADWWLITGVTHWQRYHVLLFL